MGGCLSLKKGRFVTPIFTIMVCLILIVPMFIIFDNTKRFIHSSEMTEKSSSDLQSSFEGPLAVHEDFIPSSISLNPYEGPGANLSSVALVTKDGLRDVYTGKMQSDLITSVPGNNTIIQTPPNGLNNSHIECNITNVYGINEMIQYVPHSDFETDISDTWTFIEGTRSGISYGSYEIESENGNNYLHLEQKSSSFIPGVADGWSQMSVSMTLPTYDIAQAFLTFHRKTRIYMSPLAFGTYTDNSYLSVSLDGVGRWYEHYERHDFDAVHAGFEFADEYIWDWESYVVDVTDWVIPGGTHTIALEASSITNSLSFSFSSSFHGYWDNVSLTVISKVPVSSSDVYLEDSASSTQYYFDDTGYVEFNTTGDQWIFGPFPNYYFDAQWTVTSVMQVDNSTSSFFVGPNAEFVSWEVVSPSMLVAVPTDYVYQCTRVTVPFDWTYNGSQSTTIWALGSHMFFTETGGWHRFYQSNIAIDSIIVAQQWNGTILKSPYTHLMRTEQYAIIQDGLSGQFNVDIYSPIQYVDSGFEWTSTESPIYTNHSSDFLTIRSTAPLGNYTVCMAFRNLEFPITVGLMTINFNVERFMIDDLQVTQETPEVIVSGSLTAEAEGNYDVYIATINPGADVRGPIGHGIGGLRLDDWYQSDCLISSTGEFVDLGFNVTNYYSSPILGATIQVNLVSVAGGSPTSVGGYCTPYQISSSPTDFPAGATIEFDWNNTWIGPSGIDSMLRHGLYKVKLNIVGTSPLSQFLPGALMAVTDDPLLDGSILRVHEADVDYPDFSVSFERLTELSMPGDNYFLAIIEGENHVTTETEVSLYHRVKLHSRIKEAKFANGTIQGFTTVHENGSLIIDCDLYCEWAHDTEYNVMDQQFSVDVLVDWGDGYEVLGSFASNNIGVGLYRGRIIGTIENSHSKPPGIYPFRASFSGNENVSSCVAEGLLEFGKTTISSIWSPQDGIIEAQLRCTSYKLNTLQVGPLPGFELVYEFYNGQTWQTIGTGITNETGWATLSYLSESIANAQTIRVVFNGFGFLEDSSTIFNVSTSSNPMLITGIAIGGVAAVVGVILLLRKRLSGVDS